MYNKLGDKYNTYTFSVFRAMRSFLGDKCTHVLCQKFVAILNVDHVTKIKVKRINAVL